MKYLTCFFFFVSFCSINAFSISENLGSLESFFISVKNQLPDYHYTLKKTFNDTPEYFEFYHQQLEGSLNVEIPINTSKHKAFEIKTEDVVYRVNSMEFTLNTERNRSKLFEDGIIGEFQTKAFIGFYYLEKENKGYLILSNRSFEENSDVTTTLISCVKILQ